MQQLGRETSDFTTSDWAARWVAGVASRPVLVLLLIALVVLGSLAAATRLSVDTDSSRMLAPDLPFQERARALNAAFPELKNQIVVIVEGDSADTTDPVLAAIAARLADGEAVDWVFAPAADPWLVSHGLLFLNLDDLDDQLTRLSKSANLMARLRTEQSVEGFLAALSEATALAEASGADLAALAPFYAEAAAVFAGDRVGEPRPFNWQSAVGGGDGARVLRILSAGPRLDFQALSPAKAAVAEVRAAIDALAPSLREKVTIGVTGDPVLRGEELQSVRSGIKLSLALSLALVALLLRLALGSVTRMAVAMGALAVTLIATAGFAGLVVGVLNLISIAFVVLMVGLGIDFAIHFLAHLDEQNPDHADRKAALCATARSIGTAMVLSAATTALAFLAFATTDFAGMAQLGLIGGAGVLIALAVTMTLIPALVMVWPGAAPATRPRDLPTPGELTRRWLGWVVIAAAFAVALLAPFARFDADQMNLRDPRAPSVEAYDRLAADPDRAPLRLSLLAPDAQAAKTAAERIGMLGTVDRATWLGDLIPADQTAKLDLIDLAYPSLLHAIEGTPTAFVEAEADPEVLARRLEKLGNPAASALADELTAFARRRDGDANRRLTEQVFLYFPALIDRLASQLEAGPVTAADLPQPLRRLYLAPDGTYRVEIAPKGDLRDPAILARFTADVAAAVPDAAGPPDQIAGASGAVARAILEAAVLALAGCTLLAWLTLRDLWRTAAILVPLILAGAATMGTAVLAGLSFNYANVIVVPLMIGIGIDSGVHLSLRAARTQGQVFSTSTPRAVLFSALTTIAAFGTLGLSAHRGTASMGVLLAIALALSVAVIFALTPALVRLAQKRER